MGICIRTVRANRSIERTVYHIVLLAAESEKDDVNWRPLSKGDGCVTYDGFASTREDSGLATSAKTWLTFTDFLGFELLHGLPSLLLISPQFFEGVSLLGCEIPHEALVSLDVTHVEVDLLLEDD